VIVTFNVASSADGADHLVRAPIIMQVWDFVYLFEGDRLHLPPREAPKDDPRLETVLAQTNR
jgi:hypothetical protein